jgi:hypothetical protein
MNNNPKIYQVLPDGTWDGIERYAKPDPYDVGNWLLPGGCTFEVPPTTSQGEIARLAGLTWEVVIDKRGTEFWLADGTECVITEIDTDLPEGALLEKPVKQLSPEEIANQYSAAIQDFLDNKAREKRYDNIKSAALRAALPDSPFHSEGVAAGTWMDNCWALSYQIRQEVESGTRPLPTIEELLNLMPELVW